MRGNRLVIDLGSVIDNLFALMIRWKIQGTQTCCYPHKSVWFFPAAKSHYSHWWRNLSTAIGWTISLLQMALLLWEWHSVLLGRYSDILMIHFPNPTSYSTLSGRLWWTGGCFKFYPGSPIEMNPDLSVCWNPYFWVIITSRSVSNQDNAC